MERTPTPWKVREHPTMNDCFVEGTECINADNFPLPYKREIMSDEDYPEKRADAEFIVRAVNSHDELVAALESIENDDGRIPAAIWEMRNAALRKAKGQKWTCGGCSQEFEEGDEGHDCERPNYDGK